MKKKNENIDIIISNIRRDVIRFQKTWTDCAHY